MFLVVGKIKINYKKKSLNDNEIIPILKKIN